MKNPRKILGNLKRRLLISKINQKPIILLACRRGGSTWIAEAIAAQKGVWFANEPFAVLPLHENYEQKKHFLPIKEHSQYFDLRENELISFLEYTNKLLRAEIYSLGSCKNPIFPLSINRVLLKVLNAPWKLDWFLTQALAQVIFLIRHPGSQALSVLRQNWDFGVKAYFNQLDSVHSVFTKDQVTAGLGIIKNGDQWDLAILDWVVSTHHGRNSSHKNLIKLAYEEIIVDQSSFLQDIIVEKLNFSDNKEVEKSLEKPSGSSFLSTQNSVDLIKDRNRDALISSWRSQVSREQLSRASAILELFEVDTYSMYEDKPLGLWSTPSENYSDSEHLPLLSPTASQSYAL